MDTPRFSILIPTRERPATLGHTLATVAAQPGDDYEIVVADNCSSADTREAVEALASPRVRYTRSDQVLPMAENWERGLELCTGEYVTVLGDDDGFVPSTLEMARKLIAATHAEMIAWPTHTYWWPDAIVPWLRDLLTVRLGNSAVLCKSRDILQAFYDGTLEPTSLPMIYQGFYHRGIVEEARARYDGFFVPRDAAPDIASGILGLHITESFVHSTRPLTIRGNSAKSNGTAQWARSLGAQQREVYFREERLRLNDMIHASLVPSPNLKIIIASAALKCKEAYFPDDDALRLNVHRVLDAMIDELNLEPEAYEDNLRDAEALAAKLGVTIERARIPKKEMKKRASAWGPELSQNRAECCLTVNGALAGVHHIADAARLVEALLTPVDTYPAQA